MSANEVTQANNDRDQPQSQFNFLTIFRMLAMFYALQFFFAPKQLPKDVLQPMWKLGLPVDLACFITTTPHADLSEDPIWRETNIKFGDFSDTRSKNISVPVTSHLAQNGSLYVHFYLSQKGYSPNPRDENYNHTKVLRHSTLLTRYLPRIKTIKRKKLISKLEEDDEIDAEPESKDVTIISYYWPNVSLEIVASHDPIPLKSHPKLMEKIVVEHGHYYPIFTTNDFWMMKEDLISINSTLKELNFYFQFSPIAFWKHQIYVQMQDSFKTQVDMLGGDEKEIDQVKSMFRDTNPILLGVTILVSLLHSVFDFLAFKNDIEFWKNRKNMEGLSFRTLILNIIQQLIIFLYLMDNETSIMILLSTGIGLIIECWKINKTLIVEPLSTYPYIKFTDRVKPSKLVTKTRKYDEMAFGYMSYVLFPLLAGYTIYSMFYEEHKGWYSFIIGTLVGFVYMFGFISMTPQLFINYKLKSVAHMPWKTFMYKALNTFIDDLFAFVIKMPWLHRLACLRDDVVFFVYLYQRWIYPEDPRRRNEFGQVGADDADDEMDEDQDLSELKDDDSTAIDSKEKSSSELKERNSKIGPDQPIKEAKQDRLAESKKSK